MSPQQPAQRPGGRSARVREAVHQAVTDLLREQERDELSIALVAERSGVHQATIYRRWGTITALIDDVVTEVLSKVSPIRDTGSLRGDLEHYALKAAKDLADPMGAVYLRAAIVGGGSAEDGADPPQRGQFLERARQLQAMLDRATERGEQAPTVQELIEVVLAPMYFHLLFLRYPVSAEHALVLVDRLLVIAAR